MHKRRFNAPATGLQRSQQPRDHLFKELLRHTIELGISPSHRLLPFNIGPQLPAVPLLPARAQRAIMQR
jgi:hypothetical protein